MSILTNYYRNMIDFDAAMCYNLVTLRAELASPETAYISGDNVYDRIY